MKGLKGRRGPSVSITKPCYTMASVDGKSAEITLYGEIVQERPYDWNTGETSTEQLIVCDAFLEDLDQIAGCTEITLRINSVGGDADVSNLIHNRLRELARGGAHLTCIVDGVAMSGGSLIMCACDTVQVNPSSLIMIHKAWSLVLGGYNASELQEIAESLEAYDKMQVAIYQRKTGLPEDEILGMMEETTYLTGREAVEKGFADELLEDAEPLNIAASADGQSLFVKGRQLHLAPGMFAPDSIPTAEGTAEPAKPAAKANIEKPEPSGHDEGGNEVMNTVEELRTAYPELVAQAEKTASDAAVSAAVSAEQKRIQEIDSIAGLYDGALVSEAKYGENACDARELAYRAAVSAAKKGSEVLAAMQDDAENGNKITAAPALDDETGGDNTEAMLAQAKAAAQAYNESRGRK